MKWSFLVVAPSAASFYSTCENAFWVIQGLGAVNEDSYSRRSRAYEDRVERCVNCGDSGC